MTFLVFQNFFHYYCFVLKKPPLQPPPEENDSSLFAEHLRKSCFIIMFLLDKLNYIKSLVTKGAYWVLEIFFNWLWFCCFFLTKYLYMANHYLKACKICYKANVSKHNITAAQLERIRLLIHKEVSWSKCFWFSLMIMMFVSVFNQVQMEVGGGWRRQYS